MSNVAQVSIKLSNGAEAGKTINELTKQSAQLARELKKMEIGSEEYVKTTEDYQKISSRLKEVKTEVFSTQKAQEALNSTFGDMIPFQAEFGKLAKGVSGVGTAFKAASGAANILKAALAATGIGLLIVALGTLYTWLNKTQKGMDFVGKVTASAGAAFQVIIDRVLVFAGAMADLFSGNWSAAVDGLKNTFTGLGEELKNDTTAAWEMEGAMQDIIRAEKQLEVERSRSRASIEKLKMAAEDQSKSESERLSAAQQAFNMENALLDKSIELQQKKLDLITEQNNLGTSTDEDLNRQYDAEIELNNLREESYTKQTELQNKVNELKRAGAEEAKKLAEKQFYVVSENLDKEFAALDKQVAREVETRKKAEEEKAKIRQESIAARMEQLDQEFEIEQMKLDEQFFEGQINEDEHRQIAFESEKAFLQQRLEEMAMLGETEVAQYQDIYTRLAQLHYEHNQDKIRSDEEYNRAKQQLEKEALGATQDIFGSVAALLQSDEKNRRKNFAAVKAMRIAELSISSFNEIQDIWRYANANPLNAIFPGAANVIAIGKSIAAAARFGVGLRNINQTNFADGGPVFGPSHQAGGIPFSVAGRGGYEMEGNEIILTKGVYQDPVLRSLASDINVMAGGRSFAMGGPVMRDRQMVNTNTATQPTNAQSSSLANFAQMEMLLLEIAHNTRETADKPVLATTQIRREIKKLDEVEKDAQI